MKIKFKYLFVYSLFALFCLSSCQDEITEIDNLDGQEIIVPSSNLANLISRTTANFGAADDVLDGASCFSVELPVTIVVSDISVLIETESDLHQLESLINGVNNSDDDLDFVFPIVIIFSDYSQMVIENEDELDGLINECVSDDYDSIDCVDFVYPISFSVFNSGFNLIDTVIIENDETLYSFLNDLEADENAVIVSLNFPVSLQYATGESLDVYTNQELAEAIESADQFCEDHCDDESITLALIECQWKLELYSSFPEFEGFLLNFNTDGSFDIIMDNDQVFSEENSWSMVSNATGSFLVLSTSFEDLGGDWMITECGLDNFQLTKNNQNMIIDQECEDDLNCTLSDLSAILQECPWDFSNGSGNFENDQMIFNGNGDLQISEGMAASAIGGGWNLSLTDNGIILTFLELTAFQNTLEGGWLIVECDVDRLELVKGDQTLVLERNCSINISDCDYGQVQNYLLGCSAQIPTLNGYIPSFTVFNFLSSNVLSTLYEGDMLFDGTWDIALIENQITVFINLNGLPEYNGEWIVYECSSEFISLQKGDETLVLTANCNQNNPFDCFGNVEIAVCDDEVYDGITTFNLNEIYTNCPQDNVDVYFYSTLMDAENATNALGSSYTNLYHSQTIYSRIQQLSNPSSFEIFEILLVVEDCSNTCSEAEVDAFLEDCIWNAVNYNGSDNLMDYNFDFESTSSIVVIYTDTLIIDATWSTSQSSEGVVVTFSNISGPNIQAITGNWLVVECEVDRLELHRGDDVLVLESTCN
ncbi:hypothetical protein [Winogradskyella sp. PC D3.3]